MSVGSEGVDVQVSAEKPGSWSVGKGFNIRFDSLKSS